MGVALKRDRWCRRFKCDIGASTPASSAGHREWRNPNTSKTQPIFREPCPLTRRACVSSQAARVPTSAVAHGWLRWRSGLPLRAPDATRGPRGVAARDEPAAASTADAVAAPLNLGNIEVAGAPGSNRRPLWRSTRSSSKRVGRRCTADHLIAELDRLVAIHGQPQMLRDETVPN